MADHPAKTRVLFVDDEPLVLQGLQRMLRPLRAEWEMAFVESGQAALQLMSEEPFQVIVSDMRMPGMNGAQLLSRVQEAYPKTVRLILSGHADKELILKCVGTAHQFLSKPCEPDALRAAIARGCEFDASLKSERIKQIIARMDRLPSIPALLNEVIDKLRQEDCSIEAVGEIIARDIAMTAKLLKLVNSAFFGLRRQISRPADAVTYLGIDTIKSLVLAVNAFSSMDSAANGPVSLDALWSHSLEVAGSARQLSLALGADKVQIEESFIAGMLHDIGKLALSVNVPEEYAGAIAAAKHSGAPLHKAEESVFGANHADIGGYLLSLWGLPPRVVEGICYHHEPQRSRGEVSTALLTVHLGDALSRESAQAGSGSALLDHEFLTRLGHPADLADWKKRCHD